MSAIVHLDIHRQKSNPPAKQGWNNKCQPSPKADTWLLVRLEKIAHHQVEISKISKLLKLPDGPIFEELAGPYYGRMDRRQLLDDLEHRNGVISRELGSILSNLFPQYDKYVKDLEGKP